MCIGWKPPSFHLMIYIHHQLPYRSGFCFGVWFWYFHFGSCGYFISYIWPLKCTILTSTLKYTGNILPPYPPFVNEPDGEPLSNKPFANLVVLILFFCKYKPIYHLVSSFHIICTTHNYSLKKMRKIRKLFLIYPII